MKIIIGADIVPTNTNMAYFEGAEISKLVDGGIIEVLKCADFRILNLEVPLTNSMTPIVKCGPNLIASRESIRGIKALGIDFLTLANNHILDQGKQGLQSTIDVLQKENIKYCGAGMNIEEARQPYVYESAEGKKIGIYCCAEHEFSIAAEDKEGANPFDPLLSLKDISSLREQCDFTMVLYHGGKELYQYPSPYLRKVCRRIVDEGADLVVCQHTHCIGCEEKYHGATIIYGQGNFLFDLSDSELWKTSLLVSLNINSNNCIEYIPIIKNGNSVSLASDKDKVQILNDFYDRSKHIVDDKFIENVYEKHVAGEFDKYMAFIQGKRFRSITFRVLNKLTGYRLRNMLMNRTYSTEEIACLINLLECEVHRESFLVSLKNKLEQLSKQ